MRCESTSWCQCFSYHTFYAYMYASFRLPYGTVHRGKQVTSVKFMHASCSLGSQLAQVSRVLLSNAFSRIIHTTHAACERRSTVIAAGVHSTTALHLRLVVAYCILQEVGLHRWQDAMVNSSRSRCMYACMTVIIDAVASMMTVFDCRLVQSRVVYVSFNLTLFDCRLVQSRVVYVSCNLT